MKQSNTTPKYTRCKDCNRPLPAGSQQNRQFCKPYTDSCGKKVNCKNNYFNRLNNPGYQETKLIRKWSLKNKRILMQMYESGIRTISLGDLNQAGFNHSYHLLRFYSKEHNCWITHFLDYGLIGYNESSMEIIKHGIKY